MLKNAMKKIISFIIIALLCCSVCTVFANASDKAVIYATDATAKPNDTIKTEIVLDFNPGILTLRLFLDYNRDYFELVSSTDGGILGNSTHSKDLSEDPYVLFWSNHSKEDFTQNGVIATLEFKVKENVPSGAYPLTLYFEKANDCANSKLVSVLVELDNGVFTIQNEKDSLLSSSDTTPISSDEPSINTSSKPDLVSDATSKVTPSKVEQSSEINNATSQISSGANVDELGSQTSQTTSSTDEKTDNDMLLYVILSLVILIIAVALFAIIKNKKKFT